MITSYHTLTHFLRQIKDVFYVPTKYRSVGLCDYFLCHTKLVVLAKAVRSRGTYITSSDGINAVWWGYFEEPNGVPGSRVDVFEDPMGRTWMYRVDVLGASMACN